MPRLSTTPQARQFGVYLGRVFKAERRARGIKAYSVAQDIGTTEQAISAWERGKVLPDLRNLFSACDAVGVPVWRVIARAERAYRMDLTMRQDAKRHAAEDEE